MRRSDTNLVEKLGLIGRANEDQYFHRLDQELIEKLRADAAAQAEAAEQREQAFARLVVPVDFSPHSLRALEYAAAVAERFDSTVVVVHVLAEEALEARLTQRHPDRPFLLWEGHLDEGQLAPGEVVQEVRTKAYDALGGFLPDRLLGAAGERIELRVLVGLPFERIVESAADEDADLIILGTHGRTGLPRVVTGSIAERVVRLAPCPVLTVKAGV